MVGPLFSQGMGTRSSRQVEEDHFPFDQFDSQNSELQVGEKTIGLFLNMLNSIV